MNLELVLKKLHPTQDYIFKNAKRFNHLRCGRRWGKTTLIEELCLPAVEKWPVGIWYPTHKDMSEVWKDMKNRYRALITDKNETLKQITLIGGGLIDFWSMEDPESGQGRKYKRAILDESAKAPKLYTAWENTIRPTLTDYIGDAYILSRPKGKNNPFFQIQEKHTKFDNWAFFHFTTYDNPFIDKNEIEEAKTQLDDLNFRQEYLAEYVDANDRPFLYVFDEKRHVIDSYVPNIHLPIMISMDFNKAPMTCGISQKPTFKSNIRFDEITIDNGSTPEMCDLIIAKYPQWMQNMDVTGDSTGANRTPMLVGNVNHYTIIKSKLQLKDYQLKVDRKNMELDASRILCNSVLQNAEVSITKNCVQTIQDLARAGVDEFGELIKTQAEGLHCFVSGTQVLTIYGNQSIETIKPGEFVITRKGVRKVVNVFNNGLRKVCEYVLTLENAKITLICTPDHLILTNQGWFPISKLTPGMMVVSAKTLMEEHSKSMVKEENTLSPRLRKKWFGFIGSFGNFIKVTFQKVLMSITRMRISSITISTIWNSLAEVNTCLCMFRNVLSQSLSIFRDWQRLDKPERQNGARQMRVMNLGLVMDDGLDSVVIDVVRHSDERQELMMRQDFARDAEILLESISIAKLNHVAVNVRENLELVYDIEIADQHEYFASGLLVHNCFDNWRYEVNAAFPDFIRNARKYQ